eukprot:jgi/Botrbrau1/20030/Bobra.200_1s0035.1
MGRRPRGPLKEALAQLARRMPELATSRILHHTYATLNQDYFVAVQELHRHFDLYQGVAERKGQGLWNQLAEPEWARFQVGLLSLAAMHAHMGHMGEALISLNEAVRIAQKRTDNTALAHILAELCRILWLAAPPVGPSPFISGVAPATCFRRGMELKEPHLAMYAQVTLAAFRLRYKVDPLLSHRAATEPSDNALDCVGVTEMSTTLQQLRDVNIYKLTTKMMRVTPPPPPVPPPAPGNAGPPPRNAVAEMIVGPLVVPGLATLLDPAAVSDNVDQLAVSGLLVQSAFWQRKGNPEMARAACLELLASHSDTASVEDQCLAYSHLAQSVADSQGYADAAKVLEIVDKEFPYQTNRPLEATRLGVAHDLAVRRKDLQYSKQLAAQISGLASMSNALDLDLRVEGERRAVLSLWASGRLEEAAFAAQSLFSMCLKSGSQVEAVKVLMMVGDLMMEAGTPFLALPYYLSCTHHASVFQVPLLDAEASMKVGLVGLALGPAVAPSARRLIYESLPMLMGAAPLALKAQAYMAHADVMLTSSSLEDILAQPERVMEPLGAAADIYYGLQDWAGAAKAVHLLAVLHHKAEMRLWLYARETAAHCFEEAGHDRAKGGTLLIDKLGCACPFQPGRACELNLDQINGDGEVGRSASAGSPPEAALQACQTACADCGQRNA